jgi:hypothetical protein
MHRYSLAERRRPNMATTVKQAPRTRQVVILTSFQTSVAEPRKWVISWSR